MYSMAKQPISRGSRPTSTYLQHRPYAKQSKTSSPNQEASITMTQ
jgi:hypothetical protein